MHTQPMNQEIARLHRAETLRMSRRHVAIEDEVEATHRGRALLVRLRSLVRRPARADAARAH